MKVKEYPPRQVVAPGFENLPFDGASRPKENLYALKYSFGTQAIVEGYPSALGAIEKDYPESSKPRAYRLDNEVSRALYLPRLSISLLRSLDGAISIMVCDQKKNQQAGMLQNVDGDEVWYIHRGNGIFISGLGGFLFAPESYIYIPKGMLYAFLPFDAIFRVGMESKNKLLKPSFDGFIKSVPYDDEKCIVPNQYDRYDRFDEYTEFSSGFKSNIVFVKRANNYFWIEYRNSVLDCAGWSGNIYPFLIQAKHLDFPTLSRNHTDPTHFATFATEDGSAMISTFLPRHIHSLPYHHFNNWDEALFYAKGDYAARGGIVGAGDMTFHPQGFAHGPQPSAHEAWPEPKLGKDQPFVDELAIMFESRSPLIPTKETAGMEIPDYWKSWSS
ncbi:homogentisate 1,2-dioxygenase [bacterium]|nr:homogentisate 1,2-dioxygenase [bacterium]